MLNKNLVAVHTNTHTHTHYIYMRKLKSLACYVCDVFRMLLERVQQSAQNRIFCARKIIVRSQSDWAWEEGLLYRKTGLLFEYPTTSGNNFTIKKLNVFLTVHRSMSVKWNQRDALFIQFIENQELLHVDCATIAVQSWHSQLTLYARNIPSAVCAATPEDEQVML
jgi:hypothetical protein